LENKKENRESVVQILKEQINIERKLVNQYNTFGGKIENIPIRRILHMIMFDSQKHIESLLAAIDIIEERDILQEDRKLIKEGLRKHIELEMESIKAAESVLTHTWIKNNQGLMTLLETWRDDEKRHHKILKKISEKPFIKIDPNDWVTIFRDEEFLEKRYIRSKQFLEKEE
jgi:hypothetical protein